MTDFTNSRGDRGLSTTTGTVLMLAIVVTLAALAYLATSGLVDENTTELAGVTFSENPDEGTVTAELISLQQPQNTDRVLLVHGGTLETLGTMNTVGETTDITPPADGSRILVIAVDDNDENPKTVIRDYDPGFSGSTTDDSTPFSTAPNCTEDVTYTDKDNDGYWGVDNVYELQCINEFGLEKNYELTQDIDASETSNWNDGKGFVPLGYYNNYNDYEAFTGDFKGRGHTVKELYIDRTDTDGVGLFALVFVGSSVDNVSSQDTSVTGNGEVGGLVGKNGGSIDNSSVTGDVSGNYQVGGLVGESGDNNITNSYATADVTGESDYVGGLVGKMGGNDGDQYSINNSFATGDVSGNNRVGGLVGSSGGNDDDRAGINNSFATGDVSGNNRVGGLAGYSGADATNSFAAGDVSGNRSVGGFVGLYGGGGTGGIDASTDNSSATGSVTGDNRVGGFVGGSVYIVSIDNSSASGDVTGNTSVGGFLGYSDNYRGSEISINNSYTTSSITGDEYVGGVLGYSESRYDVNIDNSYHAGQLEGNSNTGGIAPAGETNAINDSYWDESKSNADPGAGGTPLSTEQMTGSSAEDNMNLDFNNTWRTTDSYPELQAEG